VAEKIRLVTPLERTLYLKTLQPLRDLGSEDLAQIAQDAEEQYFRRGERLLRLGEPVTRVHIITDGRVAVSSPELGSLTMAEREPVGVLTMLSGDEKGIDAVAETDVHTLMIADHVLLDIFEDNFTVLHNQILALARRTLEARKNIADGTYLAPAEALNFQFKGDMDLIERVLYLRRAGGFQERNMDALIHLAMAFEEERLEAGQKLWKAGDNSGSSYILLQGSVRCTLENGHHFRAGPGYPLGNLESQALAPRWYEAVVETPVVALTGSTDTFIDVLEDHFSLALDFLGALARNLLQITREAHQSQSKPSEVA